MSDKGEIVIYLCPNSPHFKMRLSLNAEDKGHRVQAVNGVLRVTVEQARILDALMQRPDRGDLRSMLRKANIEAAEKVVAAHKASKSPAAVSGPFTSSDLASKKLQQSRREQDERHLTGKQGGENTGIKTEPSPMQVPRGKGPLIVNELDISQVNPIPATPSGALNRINRT